jgi:hypothetical protein
MVRYIEEHRDEFGVEMLLSVSRADPRRLGRCVTLC